MAEAEAHAEAGAGAGVSSSDNDDNNDNSDNSHGFLASLPVELLYRIARHLRTSDLCELRLTCRNIEQGLRHNFYREFFRRRQFFLAEDSLQALVDMSRHALVGQQLERISVGLDRFGLPTNGAFSTRDRALAYHEAAAAQHALLHSGGAVEMLAEAFAHLPRLATVDLRDFNSPTRFRDSEPGRRPAEWRSYRTRSARLDYDYAPDMPGTLGDDHRYACAAFTIVLAALVRARARPDRLEVLLRGPRQSLDDNCFSLTTRDPVARDTLLAGLRTLHLDLCLPAYNNHISCVLASRDATTATPPPVPLLFNAFLAKATGLEWLRLNFPFHTRRNSQHADGFADSLAAALRANPLHLRRLDLGSANILPSTLLALLQTLPGLQALSLRRIQLREPQIPDGDAILWSDFLRRLTAVLELHEISIVNATEATTTTWSAILFDGAPCLNHTGRDTNTFISNVADNLCSRRQSQTVQPPPFVRLDDDSDEQESVSESDDADVMDI